MGSLSVRSARNDDRSSGHGTDATDTASYDGRLAPQTEHIRDRTLLPFGRTWKRTTAENTPALHRFRLVVPTGPDGAAPAVEARSIHLCEVLSMTSYYVNTTHK